MPSRRITGGLGPDLRSRRRTIDATQRRTYRLRGRRASIGKSVVVQRTHPIQAPHPPLAGICLAYLGPGGIQESRGKGF
jgi:hypothetical protein